MTPEEYIEQLGQLAAQGLDRESLEFAARVEPTVGPPLSAEQLDLVGGTLEMSAMAVAMLGAKAPEAEAVEVSPPEEPARRG